MLMTLKYKIIVDQELSIDKNIHQFKLLTPLKITKVIYLVFQFLFCKLSN